MKRKKTLTAMAIAALFCGTAWATGDKPPPPPEISVISGNAVQGFASGEVAVIDASSSYLMNYNVNYGGQHFDGNVAGSLNTFVVGPDRVRIDLQSYGFFQLDTNPPRW